MKKRLGKIDTSSQVSKIHADNLAQEPEILELKRMLAAGELAPRRTLIYLKVKTHDKDTEDTRTAH